MTKDYPEIIKLAQEAIEDKMGRDIRIYDVRGKSSITDYFMVTSAASSPQLRAIAESVKVGLKEHGIHNYRVGGTPDSGWIVLDFLDVVIHLFLQETRAYYAIEELWEEADQ
jgi:ribosome-associated protein